MLEELKQDDDDDEKPVVAITDCQEIKSTVIMNCCLFITFLI